MGTSVRITDLFKHIPVRRQTVLKSAAKTIAKIKKLLQSYAFARPSIRLSFKILKAKNENNNWIYVSKPDARMADATLKILGSEVFIQCVYKEWPAFEDGIDGASGDDEEAAYRINAFLPKSDAGQFQRHYSFLSADILQTCP